MKVPDELVSELKLDPTKRLIGRKIIIYQSADTSLDIKIRIRHNSVIEVEYALAFSGKMKKNQKQKCRKVSQLLYDYGINKQIYI